MKTTLRRLSESDIRPNLFRIFDRHAVDLEIGGAFDQSLGCLRLRLSPGRCNIGNEWQQEQQFAD